MDAHTDHPDHAAIIRDLLNPALSILDAAERHARSLTEMCAIIESDAFRAARAAYSRLAHTRTELITEEADARTRASLLAVAAQPSETERSTESARKAASRLATLNKSSGSGTMPVASSPPACSPPPPDAMQADAMPDTMQAPSPPPACPPHPDPQAPSETHPTDRRHPHLTHALRDTRATNIVAAAGKPHAPPLLPDQLNEMRIADAHQPP